MKYQLFAYQSDAVVPATGLLVGERAYDLGRAAKSASVDLQVIAIDGLLEDWAGANEQLQILADSIAANPSNFDAHLLDLQALELASPLQRPGTIYAAGANYRDHVAAMALAFNMNLSLDPRADGIAPWHFIKAGRGSLAAHKQIVEMPEGTKKLDWEAELAVVIGRRAYRVSADKALDYVAGYTCANDLSARDSLVRDAVDASSPFRFDWIGHKVFNGACPLGPYLTPAQFVADPENLDIKLWRNGTIEQDSNTSNHLYGIADQIEYLSQRVELFPGDVILTGTPAGVGMEKGVFLARGDVLKVWIDGLGELETIIA
ncbi:MULTISPECIES: fumarylacetoacetate hydrolase family protein [Pseudomonas]|jgi:2-keto-4-pentenoate hydratase/2-oxohepta-3-ene-1,7-dioic acid hydratase in catechol pathway|uniref:2-keto-4-pentenoate hydratase n=2 Tax=Pseudomonas TaxID=286 RepID=A0A1H0UQC2_PSERE|nr:MULTISPECIES: fumarylacetoacetate hydrolase family protein [Pseudomonas]KAB0488400.1 fumarylacetoacetate hydrolase family protein [Pseudomonas reinekei]KAB0509963.1 fumarylacetoacetate hydrolase family protein [Pseudomonas moorei]OLU05886.1 2-keto-4-pentenoate hydratase [Pseudomonas reinekei]SDP68036.1 2-keto-4-pentenoate hydratase/2-oxohepta-3-ene-1,7-dioic acid hydratase (catechol pathway) [Pseudomonas reinekei]SDQ93743.1 2-keto-4-pentenoate hydratase/2-oxohepta-3-ene-1,7-dioic acid hydra